MNTVEKTTFQDLIDGNACVGPDGGIWYPSGPADVPVVNIFTALVNEARSHRKTLAHCKFEFDRAEKAEAERDVLIEHFHVDNCPVERGFDAPSWCQSEEQCGDWTCDFGVADCWRKWAAQEAQKAGA